MDNQTSNYTSMAGKFDEAICSSIRLFIDSAYFYFSSRKDWHYYSIHAHYGFIRKGTGNKKIYTTGSREGLIYKNGHPERHTHCRVQG
jgi:hypothetical protein